MDIDIDIDDDNIVNGNDINMICHTIPDSYYI